MAQDGAQQATEVETTTLLHNEEESFALAPVEASAMKGPFRTKRKRKLIVDEVKAISGKEMKGQLSDTGDIVPTFDLAPPTKRLMHWKETGGVEKLFALPGRLLQSRYTHVDHSANPIVRASDAVKRYYKKYYKTMTEQMKEQLSAAEVVTLDEDEDQEEIDVIEIVEVSDEDEDEEDEVSFVSEREGIFMTAEEKEVFRKCLSKKKLLN